MAMAIQPSPYITGIFPVKHTPPYEASFLNCHLDGDYYRVESFDSEHSFVRTEYLPASSFGGHQEAPRCRSVHRQQRSAKYIPCTLGELNMAAHRHMIEALKNNIRERNLQRQRMEYYYSHYRQPFDIERTNNINESYRVYKKLKETKGHEMNVLLTRETCDNQLRHHLRAGFPVRTAPNHPYESNCTTNFRASKHHFHHLPNRETLYRRTSHEEHENIRPSSYPLRHFDLPISKPTYADQSPAYVSLIEELNNLQKRLQIPVESSIPNNVSPIPYEHSKKNGHSHSIDNQTGSIDDHQTGHSLMDESESDSLVIDVETVDEDTSGRPKKKFKKHWEVERDALTS